MRRLVASVLSLGVLAGLVLVPALYYNVGTAAATYEETSITSYDAEFTVDADGDMTVRETLDVQFPGSGKHGIFRFFDVVDPSEPSARRIPRDITVTLDGSPEEVTMLREGRGRYRVARIGQESVTLDPGEHTYVITYRVDGVLQPGDGAEPTQFYWNLVPGGWQQSIAASRLVVHLPVAPGETDCAVGVGETTGCTPEVDGTTVTVTTGALPPRTPVTLRAGLDMPTPPAGDTRPWTARFDPVFGPSVYLLPFVAVLAFLAGLVGHRAARGAREVKPPYPLQYAPPAGIGPAQAAYVFTERAEKEAFVGTVLHAAERGAVKVDRADGAWTITDVAGPAGWARLDETTGRIARLLPGEGGSFVALPRDVGTGKILQSELASFASSTKAWAREQGLMVSSGLGGVGGWLAVAAWITAAVLALFAVLNMSILAVIPGAFAIAASPLMVRGSGTKRTAAGRDLWSRVGGFHRVLSTPSSKQRFDFSGRQELYTAYIPWAVALGCADQWAAKYRTEMGVEPPIPSYFGAGYAGVHTGNHVDQMLGDFSSTLDSAISSYQATQSSSSSGGGGGGFSGGGGGGGGGGGSW